MVYLYVTCMVQNELKIHKIRKSIMYDIYHLYLYRTQMASRTEAELHVGTVIITLFTVLLNKIISHNNAISVLVLVITVLKKDE